MTDFPRSLIEFQQRFGDEAACAQYLAAARWPDGFVCPGCGGGKAWRLETQAWTYECASCGREVQDLDLDGTELVVLSACKTAQGQIDYGEGVSGLVRALRTAGARHVLVTLRKISDEGAADFVQRFYRHWLGQ